MFSVSFNICLVHNGRFFFHSLLSAVSGVRICAAYMYVHTSARERMRMHVFLGCVYITCIAPYAIRPQLYGLRRNGRRKREAM